MEKLLAWSIAQTTGDQEAITKLGEPDPALLQQLFGAGNVQDDPTLMKQNLFILQSDEADLENRLIAADNFEMLIENLDNAMNLENMKMWSTLLELVDSCKDVQLTIALLSIIGTALQNNDKSQADFMTYETGLPKLEKILNTAKDEKLKLKCLYALSSLLRHNAKACDQFQSYDALVAILTDPATNDKLKLRALSLISAILSNGHHDQELLHRYEIVSKLVQLLAEKDHDVNLQDKSLHILANDLHGYKFNEFELKELQKVLKALDPALLNSDDLNKLIALD